MSRQTAKFSIFEAMQGFFAQDGIALYRYAPGQWLAQSDVFANLPTASLDRVIGRNIDPWLVGGATPTGPATLLRRLQNEMQMLLYTHGVNANRGSFGCQQNGQMLNPCAMPSQYPAPGQNTIKGQG